MRTDTSPFKPPLRWAGSKQRIAPQLLRLLPRAYGRFIEPMAGSAALFFAAKPQEAILADNNPELINFYEVLSISPEDLVPALLRMTACKREYYRLRDWRPRSLQERAVRFAYLNRLCWNGLYRVNKKGEFNVPMGNRLPTSLWDRRHLERAATLLSRASLMCADFQAVLDYCRPRDFVFLDPPYPKGARNGSGFNRYTSPTFTIEDHKRLASVATCLAERGAYVMVTLSWSKALLSIYSALPHRKRLRTSSLIACSGDARGGTYEAVLRNYTSGSPDDEGESHGSSRHQCACR